ncbi:myo-inositol 2-dehydrogenase/D-chiro-inositol 1-dehydrogenase [Hamadaea flava]|uniref:Gfo/Idh/MocA family oxidoreductase n=1 Tax=Hamadaea flava TaxID=1742688 RepID=A0ABV8LX02_9ACTN|nr:Gfo/Idh/MocA family oxidoreductase [Hamadaea flava]MCP2329483.1 myo-inositol 2-dehydrogenase/D-chiro-inositol 1-dehydrogenase [Hamadaea flava]
MRIGVAGVGRIGAFHAETLRNLAGVDELVLADAYSGRAKEVATSLGADWTETVDELLAANLDGLVVAVATDAHADLILRGVDRDIPVFCEKPVAPDATGTLAVVDRVARSSVPVQIGFQRRFDAGYTAAREAVAAGRLGWVHTLRGGTLDAAPPPAAYIPVSGGIFRDCSVHDFDIVRWVTGREVVEVYAAGANRGEDFFREADDVDTAVAVLTFDDGAFATISATRYNAAGYDVRLDVLGSQDSISVGLDDRLPLRSAEPGVGFPTGTPYPGFMERFEAAYRRELSAFADIVAGRAEVTCSVHDALAAFRIAEACDRSRREHRPVRIEGGN